MQLWCNCNSKWVNHLTLAYFIVWGNRQVTKRQDVGGYGLCYHCDLYKWIDADYENMMYDLRGMNK